MEISVPPTEMNGYMEVGAVSGAKKVWKKIHTFFAEFNFFPWGQGPRVTKV